MSHTVGIYLVADQEINILGRRINIHDLQTINLDSEGRITDAYLNPTTPPGHKRFIGWLSKENQNINCKGGSQ